MPDPLSLEPQTIAAIVESSFVQNCLVVDADYSYNSLAFEGSKGLSLHIILQFAILQPQSFTMPSTSERTSTGTTIKSSYISRGSYIAYTLISSMAVFDLVDVLAY